MKFQIFSADFHHRPQYKKFHRNASSGSCTDMHRQMDKQLDMMKLIGVLCKYSKVPTKWTEHT